MGFRHFNGQRTPHRAPHHRGRTTRLLAVTLSASTFLSCSGATEIEEQASLEAPKRVSVVTRTQRDQTIEAVLTWGAVDDPAVDGYVVFRQAHNTRLPEDQLAPYMRIRETDAQTFEYVETITLHTEYRYHVAAMTVEHTLGQKSDDVVLPSIDIDIDDCEGDVCPPPETVRTCIDPPSIAVFPPDTGLVQAPPPLGNERQPLFGFSSDQIDVSFEFQLDNSGVWEPCDASLTTRELDQGEHTLQARAINCNGFPDPTPVTYDFIVDSIAPVVSITHDRPTGPDGTAHIDDAEAMLTLTPNEDDVQYFCRMRTVDDPDDKVYSRCVSPVRVPINTVFRSGHTYYFDVFGIDPVGNSGKANVRTLPLFIDQDPPVVSFNGAYPQYYNALPIVYVTETYDTSGIQPNRFCRAYPSSQTDPPEAVPCQEELLLGNDGNPVSGNSPARHTLTGLADGTYVFEVFARDYAWDPNRPAKQYKHQSETISKTFTLDTTAPVITTVASPVGQNGITNARDVRVELFSNETVTVTDCSIDGGGIQQICLASQIIHAPQEGLHVHTLTVADAAGNPASATTSWTLDTQIPQPYWQTRAPNFPTELTNESQVELSFSADESGADFYCQYNENQFACTSPLQITTASYGHYSVSITAVDLAGNAQNEPLSYQWRYFGVTSATLIAAPALGSTDSPPLDNDRSPFFKVQGSGHDRFECRVDGALFNCPTVDTISGPVVEGEIPSSLADGVHDVTITALGVEPPNDTVTWNWEIDATPPTSVAMSVTGSTLR